MKSVIDANQKSYLQNLGNKLVSVIAELDKIALANELGELIKPINDLVVLTHSVHHKVQENEQLDAFYVVGDDSVKLETDSDIRKFLGNEA